MSYEIDERIIKEKGYNSAAVSRGTGISQTVFSEWKKGKSAPKADKLKKIASFLGCTVDELLGDDDAGYYADKQTELAAEAAYQNERMHLLFNAQRGASDEAVQKAVNFLEALKLEEQYRDGHI